MFYPKINPYNTFTLQVSDIHTLYVEESGNPKGIPIIRFHGGPGFKSKPDDRRYFDPQKYRIILFDQRGCGKSSPAGCLKQNTTQNLLKDIEKIRKYLKIKKWIVFGRSWGSTLALKYAQKYPKHISFLFLGGVYAFTNKENEWVFNGGIKRFFPEIWEKFIAPIPKTLQKKPLNFYIREILGKDNPNSKIVKAFMYLEANISTFYPETDTLEFDFEIDERCIKGNKIFLHYLKNAGFMEDGELLKKENIEKMKDIPGIMIQSKYDMVCPPQTAWKISKFWKKAKLEFTYEAGHRSSDGENQNKIIQELDKLKI